MLDELESGECRRIHSTTAVHEGNAMGLDLFALLLGTRLVNTRQQYTAASVEVRAHMNDVKVALLELTPYSVEVIPHLREQAEGQRGHGQR